MMVDPLKNAGPSLARRLMISLMTVVTGVTLLTGWWFYADAVTSEKARSEEKAKQVSIYLQGALRLPLWNIDDQAVNIIGQTLMEDLAFTAVTIRDANGRLIFAKQRDDEPSALKRVTSIAHAGENIGSVELSLSLKAIRTEGVKLLWALGGTLVSVLLVISLGTAFLIRLFLKRPLTQLTTAAESFGSGAQRSIESRSKNYREFHPLLTVLTGMENKIHRQIEKLEKNEEKFRTIFDGVNDAIVLHNAETGEIITANRRACEIWGYSVEEIRRLTVGDLSSDIPPYTQEEALNWIVRTRHGDIPLFQWQAKRRNGELFWFEVNMRQAWIGGNERIMVVLRDITERKQAETALRKSEGRFRTLVEAANSMILVLSPEGRILEINPYAEKILGVHRQELLDKDYIERYLPEEVRQAVREEMAQVLRGKDSFGLESPVTSQDGTVREFLWNISHLEDDIGKPYGVLAIGQDITQKQELDRLKSEFISTAAHELRTPLTSIKGFAELLSSAPTLDETSRKEYLDIIFNKSEDLERIIHDLLDISRVESGRVILLEKKHCDLKPILRRLVDSYSMEFSSYRFEVTLPEGEMTLCADPYKIEQVLENLLGNAVKFSGKGSLIKVCCEAKKSQVQISVQDQGIGMTPEQAERCFDKFYRVDASNTGKQGLGLGLSIIRAIIEGHRGKVWVESEPGRGTTISFTIPTDEMESIS